MKTVEIKIYKFEELEESVQDMLIEGSSEILVQSDWYEPIIEGFIEDMKELGHDISPKDIYFSGFYSQGDGACFTTRNGSLDLRSVLKGTGIKLSDLPRGFGKAIDEGELVLYVTQGSSRYYHERSVNAYIDYSGNNDKIYAAADEITNEVEGYLQDIMTGLYESLERYYEELTSPEAIRQEFIELDDDYLASGILFRG